MNLILLAYLSEILLFRLVIMESLRLSFSVALVGGTRYKLRIGSEPVLTEIPKYVDFS